MSTELDAYLRDAEIGDADFAPLIGRDRSMVSKLRRGIVRPTLDLAAVIERVTEGRVPMHSWIRPEEGAEPEPAPDDPPPFPNQPHRHRRTAPKDSDNQRTPVEVVQNGASAGSIGLRTAISSRSSAKSSTSCAGDGLRDDAEAA